MEDLSGFGIITRDFEKRIWNLFDINVLMTFDMLS